VFTLIELLVVISIIALLIGILLSTLSRARGIARALQCATNLRTIGEGSLHYANDNDDKVFASFSPQTPKARLEVVVLRHGQQGRLPPVRQ